MTTQAMTQTSAAPSGRPAVADVSVLVLARPDSQLSLDELLSALETQHTAPSRILVAGLDPRSPEATAAVAHAGLRARRIPVLVRPRLEPDRTETATGQVRRWRVFEDARASLPADDQTWLWVLLEDSRPAPGALTALTTAARRSSRVGMVGPKLVRDDDPRLLVGVGHQVSVGGRPLDAGHAALVDQGQLDLRQDVLAVPLAGALVRSDLLKEAGGIDPAFGEDGVDGLDLGWRLHLGGHRVVVAPDAVVRQGAEGLGVASARTTRIRTRQVALARGPVLASALRRVGIVLTSLLAALVLLLVKRPAEAAEEWADVRAALLPGRGWGARWRFRGRRRVPGRHLRGLFVPSGTGLRSTLDVVGAALDPRSRAEAAQLHGRRQGAVESGPVSEELAELGSTRRRRRWSWPLTVALLLSAVLAGWHLRGLLAAAAPGSSGVAGGELGPATTGADGLWRSALDAWRGGGLGHAGPAETWLVPTSVLARVVEGLPGGTGHSAGVALTWLLLAAVPLSVLTSFLALRRATRRGWLRAGLALGYAALLPLTAAVAEGRVGPVVVHVLAPLLVAGYAVSAARVGGSRRAAAAFATVLGVVLAAQWVPVVLVLSTVGGLLLLLLGRGHATWRGAVLALLPWALLAPALPGYWADGLRLLGGAGATASAAVPAAQPPVWQLALLNPGSPVDPSSWSALPLWAVVPVWLAALVAVAVPGPAGRRATLLVGVALGTLAGAALLSRLDLGSLPDGVATVWPGTLLSLTGAALLLAAALVVEQLLATVDGYRRPAVGAAPRGAGGVVVGATAVAVLLPLVLAGAGAWGLVTGRPAELAATVDPLPAVAAEQGRGPSGVRILQLHPAEDAAGADVSLTADLVGAEPEPARILRDRARELVAPTATTAASAASVQDAATGLSVGSAGPRTVQALQRLGVGFVQVSPVGESDSALVARIDRVPGLARVSSPEGEALWRISGLEATRLPVLDADGQVLGRLPVTGPHSAAAGVLQDLPDGATLRVAEGPGWAATATATVDGEVVPVADDGTVALPAGTHEVSLRVATPAAYLHLLAGVLAVLTGFLALPFGRPETEEVTR